MKTCRSALVIALIIVLISCASSPPPPIVESKKITGQLHSGSFSGCNFEQELAFNGYEASTIEISCPNGDYYSGELDSGNNPTQGHGRWTGADGSVYTGSVVNGVPHGRGTYLANGESVTGDWENGKLVKADQPPSFCSENPLVCIGGAILAGAVVLGTVNSLLDDGNSASSTSHSSSSGQRTGYACLTPSGACATAGSVGSICSCGNSIGVIQ